MIRKNDVLQCLECTDCGDVVELSRAVHGDPEKVFLLQEQMAQDHRNCAATLVSFGGDKKAAKRSADFDRRMRVEMARLPKAG